MQELEINRICIVKVVIGREDEWRDENSSKVQPPSYNGGTRSLPEQHKSGRVSRTGPGSCVIVSKESPRDPLINMRNLEVLWSPSRREPACRKALGICELCSCSVPALVWSVD